MNENLLLGAFIGIPKNNGNDEMNENLLLGVFVGIPKITEMTKVTKILFRALR